MNDIEDSKPNFRHDDQERIINKYDNSNNCEGDISEKFLSPRFRNREGQHRKNIEIVGEEK